MPATSKPAAPAATPPAAPPPPKFYTVDDLAEAKGVDADAMHRALYRARKAERDTGEPRGPKHVPEPDEGSRILRWSTSRADVIAWITDESVGVWR